MVRHYKRKISSRAYRPYDNNTLSAAVNDVKSGSLTQREAAKKYNIPRSTLQNKLKNRHASSPGHPKTFNNEEETVFVKYLTTLANWGFPLTEYDLRYMVKGYLDRQGRQVIKFNGNLPGHEWALSFMKRHKDILTKRMCQNITHSRASVDQQQLRSYFENLQDTLKDIQPENIINYDETNLTDEPGRQKCIFRRGVKYPERILNTSKGAISLMFAASATGEVLPVYVVYKSDHLWDTWTQGGPDGTRYNRSKSGWFDAFCFKDWFLTVALPFFRRKDGRKVIIGDNLSSHFSIEILQECEKHDISFVCLPPNSTHMCQPLDIAFFRPLKIKWRELLNQWKVGAGRRSRAVCKDKFPSLLKQLMDKLSSSQKANVQAGFQKSGIYPLDANAVLYRLPKENTDSATDREEINSNVSESLIDLLKTLRYGDEDGPSKPKRRKKLSVDPGKSISVADVTTEDEDDGISSSDSSISSDVGSSDESDEKISEDADFMKLCVGRWVLVKYAFKKSSNFYVGRIINKKSSESFDVWEVQFCRKVSGSTSLFAFNLDDTDVDEIDGDQVVRVLPQPNVNRQGQFRFDCSFDGVFVH